MSRQLGLLSTQRGQSPVLVGAAVQVVLRVADEEDVARGPRPAVLQAGAQLLLPRLLVLLFEVDESQRFAPLGRTPEMPLTISTTAALQIGPKLPARPCTDTSGTAGAAAEPREPQRPSLPLPPPRAQQCRCSSHARTAELRLTVHTVLNLT